VYTEFYNFTEEPFNLTPDPRFLYLTPQHREALASMIYGIREHRGFISVTGEVGTGKTTLVYSLLDNLNEKVKPVFIYHTSITFEDLLRSILLELGVEAQGRDKLSCLRMLSEYLARQLERDSTVAVVIDEAQNLSVPVLEELRMLSNLETSKTKLIQILLVGQPELENKLNLPELRQLKQRIGIRRQIKPLTARETRKYIQHRLALAGGTVGSVFTRGAVSMIWRYSGGIPRNINIICENAFLIGYGMGKKKIDRRIIREVIEDMNAPLVSAASLKRAGRFRAPVWRMSAIAAAMALTLGALALVRFDLVTTTPPFLEKAAVMEKGLTASQAAAPSKAIPGVSAKGARPPDSPTAVKTPARSDADTQGPEYRFLDTIDIREGTTVADLAQRYYGAYNETLIDIILKANPSIADIRRIPVHQKINIPEISFDLLIIEERDNEYAIHAGTFRSLDEARELHYENALTGKKIVIIPRKVSSSETWYKVLISRYETREECMQALAALAQKGVLPIPSSLSYRQPGRP
jgi:type II secretory pathway predicted ATPase ExeA/phage tail protein X